MPKRQHVSETPAIAFLKAHGVAYTGHIYVYEEHGGTQVSARELRVAEHAVIKTLVMEDQHAKPLIVLMHGDKKVSTKNLARQAGRKRIEPHADGTREGQSEFLHHPGRHCEGQVFAADRRGIDQGCQRQGSWCGRRERRYRR